MNATQRAQKIREARERVIKIRAIPDESYFPSYPVEHILSEAKETPVSYFGKPRSNPHCPVLEWPKYAWERIDQ